MKKLVFVICVVIFTTLLFGCGDDDLTYDWPSEDHPTGYKVHKDEVDLDEKYITVCADSVTKDWCESISYEQYLALEEIFNKEQWLKMDYVNYDEHDASVTVSLSFPDENNQEGIENRIEEDILIYTDDMMIIEKETEEDGYFKPYFYQMPVGTCENVIGYLQKYYQKQHDVATDLETFLSEFFDVEYETYFYHHYQTPLYKREGEWVLSDEMFCPGSPEMSEELLAAFCDTGQWAKCYYDENLFAGWNENIGDIIRFQCENLYGDDFYIRLMPHDDGRTYFTINNYAAFLAPPEVYTRVKEILNCHEDQWEIIPMEQY